MTGAEHQQRFVELLSLGLHSAFDGSFREVREVVLDWEDTAWHVARLLAPRQIDPATWLVTLGPEGWTP